MPILLYILMIKLLMIAPSFAMGADGAGISVAVYPFRNLDTGSPERSVARELSAELSGYDFIETIPVETVTEILYKIEPSLLWTEKEGSQPGGGILWVIRPETIEKVNERISADYAVYGEVMRSGDGWRITARIMEGRRASVLKEISISGAESKSITESLPPLAKQIADWLREGDILRDAEEIIRKYSGGIYSYPVAIGKLRDYTRTVPDSVALHALLLDMYLRQKMENRDEIVQEAQKIMSIYSPENEADTRYLLSLGMDPFDIAAQGYEEQNNWEKAVSIREKAMREFPFNNAAHSRKIGEDYYFMAGALERAGQMRSALEYYEKACSLLTGSSEYYNDAMDSRDALIQKGVK